MAINYAYGLCMGNYNATIIISCPCGTGKFTRQVDATDEEIEQTRQSLLARAAAAARGDGEGEDQEEVAEALAELEDEDYLYARVSGFVNGDPTCMHGRLS